MKNINRILVLLVVALGSGASNQSFPQQITRRQVGQIIEIHGIVYLKANDKAKEKKLHEVRDRRRHIYAGELARCDQGGFLTVLINRKEYTIPPSTEWYTFTAQSEENLPHGIGREARNIDGESGATAPAQSADWAARQSDAAASAPSADRAARQSRSDSSVAQEVLEKYAVASEGSEPRQTSRAGGAAIGGVIGGAKQSKGTTTGTAAGAILGAGRSAYFRSTEARGTFEIPSQGSNVAIELFTKGYDRALAVVELPGAGSLKEGLNGESAWRQTPIFGTTEIDPSQSWFVRLSPVSYSSSRLMSEYSDWVFVDLRAVGDRSTYVLQGTTMGLAPERFYFDTSTSLLLRVDSPLATPEGQFIFERYFDDYRIVNGTRIPFRIHGTAPVGAFTFNLDQFRGGVVLADSQFERPKKQ